MTSSVVIDLTASSPLQQPEPTAVSITPGNTSAPDKAKQPSSKTKRRNNAPSIFNGTSEQSDAPRASVEPPHPLPEAKEATRPSVPSRVPPSKRKRGHADHGPGTAASLTEGASEDRPGPLKRHKSDQGDGSRKAPIPLALVTPALDVSATSETAKPEKRKRDRDSRVRRPKDAKKKDIASSKEDGELTEVEGNNLPTTNGRSSTNKKRSESPSRQVSKVSGKKHKKKSKSTSGQKATSDVESPKSSISHMFFVDLDPTKDVVYEIPEVKSKYRVVQGNLLLPHHVLLETAEEHQISPSAIEVPPRDDTDSDTEDDFQLIENTNGVCFTFLNVHSLFRLFPVSAIL